MSFFRSHTTFDVLHCLSSCLLTAGGFDGVSGGMAAPRSSVVPQHENSFDPFAAAQAAAVPTVAAAAPLSNPTSAAAQASGKPAASPQAAASQQPDSKEDPAKPTPYRYAAFIQ